MMDLQAEKGVIKITGKLPVIMTAVIQAKLDYLLEKPEAYRMAAVNIMSIKDMIHHTLEGKSMGVGFISAILVVIVYIPQGKYGPVVIRHKGQVIHAPSCTPSGLSGRHTRALTTRYPTCAIKVLSHFFRHSYYQA